MSASHDKRIVDATQMLGVRPGVRATSCELKPPRLTVYKDIGRELQKRLEEMRSQMVKMQNRIAELEAPLPLLIWTSASFGLQLRQCILHPGRQGRVWRFLQILFIFLGDFIVLAFSGERLRHDQV